ncbi:hypothetical protein FSP39_023627 [Pinctada imbricata]|uniref:Major facilitator superfamily (MFS) profile domain-containing protein n=1 Tax=Pinctada imbricata TaxID=66713 RepID=A0AA88XX66_PINIB|nr:hypothetical protein FSP39_023627 [Pinctada imbricata]
MSSEGYGNDESDEKSPLLTNTTTSNSASQNLSSSGFARISPTARYGRGSPNVFTNKRAPSRQSRSSTPTVNSQIYQTYNGSESTVPYNADETLADASYNSSRDTRKSSEESSEEESDSSDGTPTQSFSFFALPRKHKMILASVCMADFLSYLSLSLLAPFFPKEASNKGVNDTISGWIFGVFALSQVLFSPVFGKLLPHVGLKFMYVSGLFLSGGTTVLFGCLDYINTDQENMTFVIFCFVLRVVLSVGCTSLNTSCYALIAKQFPDHIGTVFGIGEVFVGIGFMSGPAIGGVLYGLGGFIMPFLVIGAVLLICVPVNWCILPPDDDYQQSESNISSMVLFRSPTVIIVSLAIVVAAFIWSILDPTLEPHLREFDLGPEIVGLLFLLMSAFYAISSPIWGWVADKVSDNRVLLMIGFFFSAGGMFVMGPSTLVGFPQDYNVLWLNIVALCYLGVAASLALIPTFDIFLDVADELGFEEDMHTYGLVAGLWGSMYAFG